MCIRVESCRRGLNWTYWMKTTKLRKTGRVAGGGESGRRAGLRRGLLVFESEAPEAADQEERDHHGGGYRGS